MKDHDIIHLTESDEHYFWRVEKFIPGDVGQESLVFLRSMRTRPGKDAHGVEHPVVAVPAVILRHAEFEVLTKTRTEPELPIEPVPARRRA